jgi:hypothetical protein
MQIQESDRINLNTLIYTQVLELSFSVTHFYITIIFYLFINLIM